MAGQQASDGIACHTTLTLILTLAIYLISILTLNVSLTVALLEARCSLPDACRYIDICADYAVKRRSLQTLPSCQYSTFFFGHLPLVNGAGSVTVDNLTAGASLSAWHWVRDTVS